MRETWMRQAQGNDVMVRFFLTEEERTPATDEVRQVPFHLTLRSPAALTCQKSPPCRSGPIFRCVMRVPARVPALQDASPVENNQC